MNQTDESIEDVRTLDRMTRSCLAAVVMIILVGCCALSCVILACLIWDN